MEVISIFDQNDDRYVQFIDKCPDALVYHSHRFLNMLNDVISNGRFVAICAVEDSVITAALPLMLCSNEHGRVLNSLPYFGSHGDLIFSTEVSNKNLVINLVNDYFYDFCRTNSVDSINIVTNINNSAPLIRDLELWTARNGMISDLPSYDSDSQFIGAVIGGCLQKTRNLVRKSLRGDFHIFETKDLKYWNLLENNHRSSMKKIGGKSKTAAEFESIRKNLEAFGLAKLFVAEKNGDFAGALLNLYYKNWIEYFTPVSVEEYRNSQVLSALIVQAMLEGAKSGAKHWNWGGTWDSQSGVHHFKSGWGAREFRYYYGGRLLTNRLEAVSPDFLLEKFPYFFVRPFN